jgi:HAUS augmin-like complex subunit 1
MAHLPPNAAIFSPSVARAAASAAKDWSYVDTWLQRKFPGRGPPPFERNVDTLRALLALASANEAADEERALIARLEADTLQQLRAQEQPHNQDENDNDTLQSAREAILTSLEAALTREGQTALTAMASLAVQTNTPLPTPTTLGTELISLTTQSSAIEQTISRIQTLTAYIAREAAATATLATTLRPPSPPHHHHHHDNSNSNPNPNPEPEPGCYHPPPNLALQNLTLQRHIKTLTTLVPTLRDKATALARSLNSSAPSPPSIPQLRAEEEAYLALLALKQDLDAQVRAFQGLPPDTEQARHELEGLRAELRRMTIARDEVFEGLVERETPRKGRG